jgi:hypothetical protein
LGEATGWIGAWFFGEGGRAEKRLRRGEELRGRGW